MRLTINLDDDLYAMARSHAIATKTSISKAVGDLLRRKTEVPATPTNPGIHPLSGFPVSQGTGRKLTEKEIQRAMDDDDVRILELMGLSPQEIEEALER